MPTFHPPLAQTSHVQIPPNSADQYIQLNFCATFDGQEDSSGSWEIWTDLPRLDDHGNITSQPGEWRAVSFQLYQAPESLSNGKKHLNGDDTSNVIQIKALSNPLADFPELKTFYLSIVIPASVGQQYSYTYRHVTTSGETHWLGGIGGNGAIKLAEGDLVQNATGVESGDWSEKLESVDNQTWYGVAIELQGNQKPIIHTLPSELEFSPHLVLLHKQTPLHQSSLSRPTTSSIPTLPTLSFQNLAIVATSTPLSIATSLPLPLASQDSLYASGHNVSSVEVLTAAFRAAKAKQNRFHLAEVSGDDKDVSAILVSEDEKVSEQTYLIVYAPSISSSLDFSVKIPDPFVGTNPLAILADSDKIVSYLPQLNSGSTGRNLHLRLEEGIIGEVLRLAEFVELREAGREDAIWICAPDATQVEIGEEEIPSPAPEPVTSTAPNKQHDQVRQAEPQHVEQAVAPPAAVIEDRPAIAPETRETNSTPPKPLPPTQPAQGWWLFRFIGRFFVNIWELLLWPFKSSPAITGGSEQAENREESNQEGSAKDIPVNERTPLLGSQSMSRDTSSSSTAFDPLATPSSMMNAKDDQKPKYSTDGSVTPVGHGYSPNLNVQELPAVNSVQIRSYAQMTFNHLPPFKFLLPPNTNDISTKLRFTVKEKGTGKWEEVKAELKAHDSEAKCKELIVNYNNGTDGIAAWEVQVERV